MAYSAGMAKIRDEVVVRIIEQPHDNYALTAAVIAGVGLLLVILGKVTRPQPNTSVWYGKIAAVLVWPVRWAFEEVDIVGRFAAKFENMIAQANETATTAIAGAENATTLAHNATTNAQNAATNAQNAATNAQNAAAAIADAAVTWQTKAEELEREIENLKNELAASKKKLERLEAGVGDIQSCNCGPGTKSATVESTVVPTASKSVDERNVKRFGGTDQKKGDIYTSTTGGNQSSTKQKPRWVRG